MSGKASKQKIKRAEQRRQALALRRNGATYEQIGRQMGFSTQYAHRIVTEELRKIQNKLEEHADDVLQLHLQRLDALFMAHYPAAVRTQKTVTETDAEGNTIQRQVPCEPSRQAAYLCLSILERQSRLTGIEEANQGAEIPMIFQIGIGEPPREARAVDATTIDPDPDPEKVQNLQSILGTDDEPDSQSTAAENGNGKSKHRARRRKGGNNGAGN